MRIAKSISTKSRCPDMVRAMQIHQKRPADKVKGRGGGKKLNFKAKGTCQEDAEDSFT